MIPVSTLVKIAKERLHDAKVLCANGRYDGSIYLCGYVVEVTLKARICKTLKWNDFPESRREWEGLQSLKVHDFEQLLLFTGLTARVKPAYQAEWTVVATWQPEFRYRPSGTATKRDADNMITASEILMKVLK